MLKNRLAAFALVAFVAACSFRQGDTGDAGTQGAQGLQGVGLVGPQGPVGPAGPAGPPGQPPSSAVVNWAYNPRPGTPSAPIAPHAFSSDLGWGGGAKPAQLVDGFRGCNDPSGWACGLAFSGGNSNWNGQPCGVRQATVDLGASRPVSAVRVTHHGDEHVPRSYEIQTWNGSGWLTQVSVVNTTVARCGRPGNDPTNAWTCTLTDEFFPTETSRVRITFDNCAASNGNILGNPLTHGWIYELEVFNLPP
jgi:hypothetical protein